MSDSTYSSQPNGKKEPAFGDAHTSSKPKETSLLDLLLIVVRNRRVITLTVICCTLVGLSMAVFSASKYTSSAKVIREVESESAMGNLGGLSLLSGMGLNLGGASTGLTPDAYPDVLASREVRLAVVRDTFEFRDIGKTMTLTDYLNRVTFFTYVKRFTIGLPGTIIKAFQPKITRTSSGADNAQPFPTQEEEQAIKAVSDLIGTSIDQDTGLMTIASTTHDPFLSNAITESFVKHLVTRIESIRTQKALRDMQFIEDRYEVARDSLKEAENNLALFNDRNNNPQSARLRTQQARLERQVTFKAELFSDLQAQLTQAQIDLQRSRPVITLLERPVPAVKPSSPHRLLLIIISIVIGLVLGICLAFLKGVFDSLRKKNEEKAKLTEIAEAFSSDGWLRRFRFRLTSKPEEKA